MIRSGSPLALTRNQQQSFSCLVSSALESEKRRLRAAEEDEEEEGEEEEEETMEMDVEIEEEEEEEEEVRHRSTQRAIEQEDPEEEEEEEEEGNENQPHKDSEHESVSSPGLSPPPVKKSFMILDILSGPDPAKDSAKGPGLFCKWAPDLDHKDHRRQKDGENTRFENKF